jgi:cytochrome c oxidase subunit III
MAHEKNHDYHILPPSIWPFLGAVSAFVMLVGAVLWMHDMGPWLFLMGLRRRALRHVRLVGRRRHRKPVGRSHPGRGDRLRYGFILFIISEVMFFAAWFWSFFKHALYPMHPEGLSPAIDGVWPPMGVETFDPWHLPLINTLVLLLSGCAATWAHHAWCTRTTART